MPRMLLNDHVEFHDDGTATVTKDSILSGKKHSMTVRMTKAQYDSWVYGHALVQDALPSLSSDEREFLMSGITQEEWNKEFGDE